MQRFHRGSATILASFAALALTSRAHGYIDSGTGSFLLQSAVAGLLGGAFVLKTFWANVKSAVARRPVDRDRGSRRG